MDRIRLIATSDIHGEVFPWSYADGLRRNSGLARIRTLVSAMKDNHTIVIDNGDTLQGSPLSFYHYAKHHDDVSPVTKAMAEVGYDYMNLGNHDFDYGPQALFRHIENCGALCLTANVLYQGKPLGPRYDIREISSSRIAFFALITQYTPNWESAENVRDMTFLDAFETARDIVREIREKEDPDYIVCIYHGSFERDPVTGDSVMDDTGENEGYRMISEIPEIDIMISGHQHLSFSVTAFDTVITQTLNGAREAAVIDITDNGIEAMIVPVQEDPDEDLMNALLDEENECQQWLDMPLGTCRNNLRITDEFEGRLHKSQLITFLNKVQCDVTGADLSGSALFMGAVGFGHEITMRDLVSTYVFPNTLTVKKVSGRILKEYLEKCAEFWDVDDGKIVVSEAFEIPAPMYFNYDMVDGVEYTIQASNAVGERIVSLTRNGIPVKEDDEFTLCINNYRAAGGGNFPMIRDAETVCEDQTSMVEILASYIMNHKEICFEEQNNIQVII